MREQVEYYFNLLLTSDKIPEYMKWDQFDTPEYRAKIRLLDLDHDDVVDINIEFSCRHMVRGFTHLFDLNLRFPYDDYDFALSMAELEMKTWCNVFGRMLHIDFIHFFTGVDSLSTRAYIDGDLDPDNAVPLVDFLDKHREPLVITPQRFLTHL